MSSHEYRSRASPLPELRPRAQQDLEPLPRLLPAGEDDPVLAAARLRLRWDQDAVRDDLVLAGKPAPLRLPRRLGDGDPVVEPVGEEAPGGSSDAHPAEIARGVEGCNHRDA